MRRTVRTIAFGLASTGLLATLVATAQQPNLKPIQKLPGGGEERKLPVVANDPPVFRIPPEERIPEAIGLATAGQVTNWGHGKINVPQAWAKTKGDRAVVAILDTGIDSNHPDLKDQVIKSKNFTSSNTDQDLDGHGTHCGGNVAALDNDTGTVGVAPQAKLMNGKVLGDDGMGQMNWAAQGVDWAVDNGADVISMSLGAPGGFTPLEDAIKRAVSKGVIVVCAAGNAGPGSNTVGFPGQYEECVCVAAFDDQLMIADFSSRGPQVDVAAPGVSVLSLAPGNKVAVLSGTSMATPYVAGVAALYVSACKKAGRTPSPTEFRTILQDTSVTSNPQRPNSNSGWGRILAEKYVDFGIITPPTDKEFTFTQADFSTAGWEKMQKAGLEKFTLGFKGSQPQATPAKTTPPRGTTPEKGGSPAKPTGKTPA